MDIVTLLSTDRVACETEVSSKKRAFERLAELLTREGSEDGFQYEAVFDALVAREKLGSTALGNGIAIPHACLPIQYPKAALLRLDEGLKMDAPDKKPIHLLFALLVPASQAEAYQPLLSELALTINNKYLLNELSQLQEPGLIMNYLSSLFIRDIAA